ncbi:MAG TPA: cadherin-like beta sandwich domain-containing protein [Polyangium sp.]|nr:cadherin-like beta sandwich domain-containing protein [Polyangium sp.]
MRALARWIWLYTVLSMFLLGCLDTSGTAPPPHTVGGTVVGLSGQLTLFANGIAVTIDEPGAFVFPSAFSTGTPYEIVVISEPDLQDCTIENGSGVIGVADVTNVMVTCAEQRAFLVGGKVNGLSGKLILRNGTDTVTISGDGDFSFPVRLPDATPYAVGVETPPLNQSCTIAGAVGVIMSADVTNVNVTCLADDARLLDIGISEGALSPIFSPETSLYLASVSLLVPSVTLIPSASSADALILVNGEVVMSGIESSPIFLELGANIVSVRVQAPSGAEREYAVVVTREEKLATTYVKASNVGTGDNFGTSVAISGDLFVVGANSEDSSATGINGDESLNDRGASGAAYVYTRDGKTWKKEAYIKASNTDFNDQFGTSVAIDGNTLVVGAPGEDSRSNAINGMQNDESSPGSGAVYVFVRDATGKWSQQAYIKPSNTGDNDQFGSAVAISGDIIVVGAPGEDSNATGVDGDQTNNMKFDSGAAYVFVRFGSTWQQQAYLKSSNPDSTDQFGASVAIWGETIAVGATDEDSNTTGINPQTNESAFESGAVYVFTRSIDKWTQQAFIKASNAAGGDRFGSSVALEDNVLVVGARNEDSGAIGVGGNQEDNTLTDSGAVYVFTRMGITWTQDAYIKASNTDFNDNFGAAVSVSGNTLVVGAFGENASGVGLNSPEQSNMDTDSGAAYLFTRGQDGWAQIGYLKSLNSDPGDEFAERVSVSGSTLVCGTSLEDSGFGGIGANPYDESASDSGAVFVYH